MPLVVGLLLVVCAALLAVNVLRGGHGQAEEGEDVDLTAPTEWRVVLPLVAVFVGDVLLIDRLGWGVFGAVVFFGWSWALGGRAPGGGGGFSGGPFVGALLRRLLG